MENKLKKLEEEFGKVKKEITGISYLKKGSIVKCYQTCGSPGCRCHEDIKFRHGPYLWWISKEGGRTKSSSNFFNLFSIILTFLLTKI